MKKGIILGIVFLLAICLLLPQQQPQSEFLRIHIRANSNDKTDQAVKYRVKEAVVNYLAPFLSTCADKEQAKRTVELQAEGIRAVAEQVLKENGFSYGAKVELKTESFPTRSYDGFVLEQGVYDALIVSLGSGTGDNWWCVVYPPLCFVGGELNGSNRIRYKSKLLELIEKFRAQTEN